MTSRSNENGRRGKENECSLYDLLVHRFGYGCVYYNPKYVKKGKKEKELADIIILALPYAVLIQMKWKDISSDDISGKNGDVEWKRIVKALEKAARQFTDFRTLWEHKAVINLPQQWSVGGNLRYELDLGLIKQIIPIAIVDFNDVNYCDPCSRITVPPIVLNVPNSVDKYGSVHSFLLRDFERVVDNFFTIGDLITYLKLREKQVSEAGKFINYSEMDLFAVFLSHYNLWEDLLRGSFVSIERGAYEGEWERNKSLFEERRRIFSREDAVDRILRGSITAFMNAVAPNKLCAEAIRPCLEFSGRVNCMTSLIKKLVSDKIRYNIDHWVPPEDITEEYRMLYSAGRFAEIVLPTTVYLIAVAGFSDRTMTLVVNDVYWRLLGRIRKERKEDGVSEVLIVLVDGHNKRVFPLLRYISKEDYNHAEEYLRQMPKGSLFMVEPILESEWTYAKRDRER